MDNATIASFFKVWISQDDWESDSHKFYRSLGHMIRSAPTLPDTDTVSAALRLAYEMQYGTPAEPPLQLDAYSARAKVVIEYLRATT